MNFFLCPAPAMQGIIDQFPAVLVQPSYRSPYLMVFIIVSVPLSIFYVQTALLLRKCLGFDKTNQCREDCLSEKAKED